MGDLPRLHLPPPTSWWKEHVTVSSSSTCGRSYQHKFVRYLAQHVLVVLYVDIYLGNIRPSVWHENMFHLLENALLAATACLPLCS